VIKRLSTADELVQLVGSNMAVALYFSSPGCGVCQVLKPKVFELFQQEFPNIVLAEVDCAEAVELAAQQGIHVVPSLLVFFDRRETLRLSRNFSLAALRDQLMRPYSMCFDEG
jgi:thioredoxin 1